VAGHGGRLQAHDVNSSMVYTYVVNKGAHGVKSPVDLFPAGLG